MIMKYSFKLFIGKYLQLFEILLLLLLPLLRVKCEETPLTSPIDLPPTPSKKKKSFEYSIDHVKKPEGIWNFNPAGGIVQYLSSPLKDA